MKIWILMDNYIIFYQWSNEVSSMQDLYRILNSSRACDSGKVEGPVWFSRIASVSIVVGILSKAPTYLDEAAPF